jgi:hypothetical protein
VWFCRATTMQTKHPGEYKGYVLDSVSSSAAGSPPFSASYTFAKIQLDDSYGGLEHISCEGVFETDAAAQEAAQIASRKHVDSLT